MMEETKNTLQQDLGKMKSIINQISKEQPETFDKKKYSTISKKEFKKRKSKLKMTKESRRKNRTKK